MMMKMGAFLGILLLAFFPNNTAGKKWPHEFWLIHTVLVERLLSACLLQYHNLRIQSIITIVSSPCHPCLRYS